ncbi:MAG: hypothetical protein ACRDD1_09260, partial [Planctomycetia bacterium]
LFEDPPALVTRGVRRAFDPDGGRRSFGEEPGVISAYFYKARPMAWLGKMKVGEVEAKRFVETFPETDLGGLCLAEPLAVVQLHYGKAPATTP